MDQEQTENAALAKAKAELADRAEEFRARQAVYNESSEALEDVGPVVSPELKASHDAAGRRMKIAHDEWEKASAEVKRLTELELERGFTVRVASEQAKREDRSFWFRRFHTSLALAHGAGFAAVGSKLFDGATGKAAVQGAFYPMLCFAVGMVVAGLIPVALYLDRAKLAWGLAIGSAVLFVLALLNAVIAVWFAAWPLWPFG